MEKSLTETDYPKQIENVASVKKPNFSHTKRSVHTINKLNFSAYFLFVIILIY